MVMPIMSAMSVKPKLRMERLASGHGLKSVPFPPDVTCGQSQSNFNVSQFDELLRETFHLKITEQSREMLVEF